MFFAATSTFVLFTFGCVIIYLFIDQKQNWQKSQRKFYCFKVQSPKSCHGRETENVCLLAFHLRTMQLILWLKKFVEILVLCF